MKSNCGTCATRSAVQLTRRPAERTASPLPIPHPHRSPVPAICAGISTYATAQAASPCAFHSCEFLDQPTCTVAGIWRSIFVCQPLVKSYTPPMSLTLNLQPKPHERCSRCSACRSPKSRHRGGAHCGQSHRMGHESETKALNPEIQKLKHKTPLKTLIPKP